MQKQAGEMVKKGGGRAWWAVSYGHLGFGARINGDEVYFKSRKGKGGIGMKQQISDRRLTPVGTGSLSKWKAVMGECSREGFVGWRQPSSCQTQEG